MADVRLSIRREEMRQPIATANVFEYQVPGTYSSLNDMNLDIGFIRLRHLRKPARMHMYGGRMQFMASSWLPNPAQNCPARSCLPRHVVSAPGACVPRPRKRRRRAMSAPHGRGVAPVCRTPRCWQTSHHQHEVADSVERCVVSYASRMTATLRTR